MLINFWSKHNNRLFEFRQNDSIAIHIPVALLTLVLIQSFHSLEPSLNTIYLSIDHSNSRNVEKDKANNNVSNLLLKSEFMVSQSVNQQGEWIEAYVERVSTAINAYVLERFVCCDLQLFFLFSQTAIA